MRWWTIAPGPTTWRALRRIRTRRRRGGRRWRAPRPASGGSGTRMQHRRRPADRAPPARSGRRGGRRPTRGRHPGRAASRGRAGGLGAVRGSCWHRRPAREGIDGHAQGVGAVAASIRTSVTPSVSASQVRSVARGRSAWATITWPVPPPAPGGRSRPRRHRSGPVLVSRSPPPWLGPTRALRRRRTPLRCADHRPPAARSPPSRPRASARGWVEHVGQALLRPCEGLTARAPRPRSLPPPQPNGAGRPSDRVTSVPSHADAGRRHRWRVVGDDRGPPVRLMNARWGSSRRRRGRGARPASQLALPRGLRPHAVAPRHVVAGGGRSRRRRAGDGRAEPRHARDGQGLASFLRPWVPVVSLSKGLEQGTRLRMTQVLETELRASLRRAHRPEPRQGRSSPATPQHR